MQQYWLPCDCGARVRVDASQAGLDCRCACGQVLKVPTLIGLKKLEIAPPPEGAQVAPRSEMWARWQGLIFVGLLIAIPAFTWSAISYARLSEPEDFFEYDSQQNVKDVNSLTASQAWELWQVFREGFDRSEDPRLGYAKKLHQQDLRWVWIGGALGCIGLGVIVAGLLSRPRGTPAH